MEIIALSQKELSRARILALLTEGHVSLPEAATSMGVSKRQTRRLLRRFEKAGAAGLAHGNCRFSRSSVQTSSV
ncbi:MAG: helix-turn-helix domain-containing protein [bacterium]|nr:helix-turn-helix domain-containing protein [bacterium]